MLSWPVAADFEACSKFAGVRQCSLGHTASVGVSRRHPSASVWLIFGQSKFLSDAFGWWLTDTDAAYRSLVKCTHYVAAKHRIHTIIIVLYNVIVNLNHLTESQYLH